MLCRFVAVIGLSLLLSHGLAHAEAVQEAEALNREAQAILQGASGSKTDPKAYAMAIVKLEQAQKLLDKAKANETPLAQEVSAALFWARKFSNVNSMNEVSRLRASGVPVTSTDPPPATTKPPVVEETGTASEAQIAAAKRKYEVAERFAKEQADNPYVVALRWFQVADEVSGTDYSVKALAQARAAQERYASKIATEKTVAQKKAVESGPEYDLIKEGDALLAQNNFDDAAAKYEASIKLNETSLAHRKLGHAIFDRAQVLKDTLLTQFDDHRREYREAVKAATRVVRYGQKSFTEINWNDPKVVALKKVGEQLTAKGREAIGYYDRAYTEFSRVLALQKKDLDAAAHQGFCYSVRGDSINRAKARALLSAVIQDYLPANDMERTVYEFCKTELNRIAPK